ncbi:glycosyltransferase [Harryflintia acetispora]|uniref:glycosyltransferase n=1 Tax=Harryflintia acetispora TaxID=1849041 RepID=UPI00189894DD|nr:glycosyltransferase [Harryflintia acetispora]
MKPLRYVINLWSSFGTVAIISKVWEKYFINKYRFRLNCNRIVPEFPIRQKPYDFLHNTKSFIQDKPINICYLIHCFFPDKNGGTEQFVLNLAKEQQRLGNHVRILTLGNHELKFYSKQYKDIFFNDFQFEGLDVTQFRYRHIPRGYYYDEIYNNEPNMAAFAAMYLDKYKVNLVHAVYPQPFATFLGVCLKQCIPYVITTTDFNIICHYATLVDKRGQFCKHSRKGERCEECCKTYGLKDPRTRYHRASDLLQRAEFVTAPSEFVARVLESEFQQVSVTVVPHGISSVFSCFKKREQTKRFSYVGILSELKGVHLLISVFMRLDDSRLSLDIYGDGEQNYINRLKNMAENDSRIKFHGGVSSSHIVKVYQNSDCVVIPSLWFETYNFVLREALACGCLVIASNIGAMPEPIYEGENGFLFTPGNDEELFQKLQASLHFNWSLYRTSSFPVPKQEGERYALIYAHALKSKTKEFSEDVSK